MIKFQKQLDLFPDIDVYTVYINGKEACGVEIVRVNDNTISLENIHKNKDYQGHEVLKQVVKYLHKDYNIICMPLKKYLPYYEELGFELFKRSNNGEDDTYILVKE